MDERGILELIDSAHRLLSSLESTPRDYGTGDMLYAADMHTIMQVGLHPHCNLTQLATHLGVSKPAVFKFTKKMISLGYIEKSKTKENDKEVLFSLTASGKKAMKAHARFMEETMRPLRDIERKLTSAERESIRSFLMDLEAACSWR